MKARATLPDQGQGPRRTCVGCRTVRSQDDLVRIARRIDGSLAQGRTLPGRGAWLCRGSSSCLDLAVRNGGFARSFRAPVSSSAAADLRLEVAPEQAP